MKKYFVIHSEDPYLLARLCTDLQMEGMPQYITPYGYHPFNGGKFVHIEPDDFCVRYHDWCDATPKKNRYTITDDSYLAVLSKILNP